MTVEYRTIRDAAEAWVREMNAIPQGMIEKLMGMNPDDWTEITKPAAGDTVYVYDLPDEVDSLEHCGTIMTRQISTTMPARTSLWPCGPRTACITASMSIQRCTMQF